MHLRSSNLVFLIAFIAYVTIRGVFAQRSKGCEKLVTRRDARELILIVLVGVGTMLLPLVYLFTPLLTFADYRLPSWAPWFGALTMGAALWLFWRSHSDLGQNWSMTLEIRRGHQLIRHGVYRFIRHPMYAAMWLFGLAQGLLLQNWLGGWSAIVSFAPMYFVRAPREEEMMCEFFGEEYRAYISDTGRLVPTPQRQKTMT